MGILRWNRASKSRIWPLSRSDLILTEISRLYFSTLTSSVAGSVVNQKLNSLVAALILMASIVALYLSHALIAKLQIGIALQIAAAVLMLWARVTFGARSFHATANPTEGGLVTTGPYRYWRHPIYAAVLLFVWAGVLTQGATPSLISLFLSAAATFTTGVRIYSEEQLLRARFPDYGVYASRTKRLVPFVF